MPANSNAYISPFYFRTKPEIVFINQGENESFLLEKSDRKALPTIDHRIEVGKMAAENDKILMT